MITKFKELDFTDEKVFVGIDVHKKSWKVTIQMEEFVYKTFSQDPDVHLLENYLKKNFPD